MQKRTIIKKIKAIIEKHGSFAVGEVDADSSPVVGGAGKLLHLAEYFTLDGVEVNTYDTKSSNCNEIDSFEMNYEELSKEVLEEILFLADLYETDQEKTLKRISN
jgi:hypothetical protein